MPPIVPYSNSPIQGNYDPRLDIPDSPLQLRRLDPKNAGPFGDFTSPGIAPGMLQYGGTTMPTTLLPSAPAGSQLDHENRFIPPAGFYVGDDRPDVDARNLVYSQNLHRDHPLLAGSANALNMANIPPGVFPQQTPAPEQMPTSEPPLGVPGAPAAASARGPGGINALLGSHPYEIVAGNRGDAANGPPLSALDQQIQSLRATMQRGGLSEHAWATTQENMARLLAIQQAENAHRLQFDPARESQRDWIDFLGKAISAGHSSATARRMFTEGGGRLPDLRQPGNAPGVPLPPGANGGPTGGPTPPLPTYGQRGGPAGPPERRPIGTPDEIGESLDLIARPRVPGTPMAAQRSLIPIHNFIQGVPQELMQSPQGLAQVLGFINKTYTGAGGSPSFEDWWRQGQPILARPTPEQQARQSLANAVQRHYRGATSREIPILGPYGGGPYYTPLAPDTIQRLEGGGVQTPPLPRYRRVPGILGWFNHQERIP